MSEQVRAEQILNGEAELISILQKFDKLRGYLQFGCTSLFEYAVKRLKLSEAVASNLITVARKSFEVPELKKAIEAGELTVSKVRKITPVITSENKEAWLELAKTKSSREIEKAVATEKPELLIKEKITYKASDRIEFKTGISEEVLRLLEEVKDLESQRSKQPANFEDVLRESARAYLEKYSPIRKAQRAIKRQATGSSKNHPVHSFKNQTNHNATASVPGHIRAFNFNNRNPQNAAAGAPTRRPLLSTVRHAVTLRDLRQCTHLNSDGKRCENKKWLEVHHIIPVAKGGSNDLCNLTTLCSAHHRSLHH